MNNFSSILKKETGSALVVALLSLTALLVIGIASINTSTIELQIVRNEQIYQTHFYKAEAAVMEAAQRLAIESNVDEIRPVSTTKPWLVNPDINLGNLTTFLLNDSNSLVDNDSSFSANANGIVAGASLDITSDSNVYGFEIYGCSRDSNGNVFITIGYKKRI